MTDAELGKRAELLEAERDSWKDWAGVERQRREDVEARLRKYEEALEFYARIDVSAFDPGVAQVALEEPDA